MNAPIIIGQLPTPEYNPGYYVDTTNEIAKLVPEHQVTVINIFNGWWMIKEIRIDDLLTEDIAYIMEQAYHDDGSDYTPTELARFIVSSWKYKNNIKLTQNEFDELKGSTFERSYQDYLNKHS